MSTKDREPNRTSRAAAEMEAARRSSRNRQFLVVGAVVVALVVAVVALSVTLSNKDTTSVAASDVPSVVNADSGIIVGSADAPRTVTVYEDFQCPICNEFETATREALRTAVDDGSVQLEYRMVSFLDRASQNEYSSRALNAALVVREKAGEQAFLDFHDTLFENQPEEGTAGPDDDQLVAWAVEAGASEADVRPAIEGGLYDQYVVNATDAMSKNGVTGTPTVFVDGTKVDGSLQDSIDAALQAAGQ